MQKIRRKMIRIVILSTVAIFALCIICVGAVRFISFAKYADEITEDIMEQDGKVPKLDKISQENEKQWFPFFDKTVVEEDNSEYAIRFYCVYYTEDNKVWSVNLNGSSAANKESVIKSANEVIDSGKQTGYIDLYRFRVVNQPGNKYVILLDCKSDLKNVYMGIFTLTVVAAIMVVLISVIFIFASKKALVPFEKNAKKQRRFITDAGHELKTPLSVISANAQVIEYKSPESKEWTDSIKKQVENTNKLISQLLVLSKSEEVNDSILVSTVNFSAIVDEKLAEAKPALEEKGVNLTTNIEEDIVINANIEGLNRLISVLMDNCVKYVPEGGDVVVSLKNGLMYTTFSLSNTDINEPLPDTKRLFDRFYRTDMSRNSKTGGTGIGLSIAWRICQQHKGSISAKQDKGMITFTANIFNSLKVKDKRKDS